MQTRKKGREISMNDIQAFAKKYVVTKSGSKGAVALRVWKLRRHMMSSSDLKKVEDFLHVPLADRYKGPRYGVKKDGMLYCIRGPCPDVKEW
jgi:hypothetical protein